MPERLEDDHIGYCCYGKGKIPQIAILERRYISQASFLVPSWKPHDYPLTRQCIEDDFPFPKVGYVNSLEGINVKLRVGQLKNDWPLNKSMSAIFGMISFQCMKSLFKGHVFVKFLKGPGRRVVGTLKLKNIKSRLIGKKLA